MFHVTPCVSFNPIFNPIFLLEPYQEAEYANPVPARFEKLYVNNVVAAVILQFLICHFRKFMREAIVVPIVAVGIKLCADCVPMVTGTGGIKLVIVIMIKRLYHYHRQSQCF